MAKLQEEILQTRPFETLEQEAMLTILHTAEVLGQFGTEVMKPFGITATQYNVLRILRGADPQGLPASDIATRMITRDPDITRLLQRLETSGFATRERGSPDRRVILARITDGGLALLNRMDAPLAAHIKHRFSHLHPGQLQQLISLLNECRRNPSEPPSHLST